MKRIFTLLTLLLFFSFSSFSQGHVNYNSSKWYLGLNMGGTYHSNTEVDVNKQYKIGFGFTAGKSFGMEKGNILSWDLRVRYLFGSWRGLSTQQFNLDSTNTQVLNLGSGLDKYQESYGYYVPNFQTWVNDWSLELQVNTNRLRERTGWNLFAFGGIGLTHYTTSADLYDNDFGSSSSAIKDENQLSDKNTNYTDFETEVTSTTEWMPHFGAGISRQLSPNISFELMGRMSWTRNNDFDAMPYNFDGSASKNDRYHYASAGFKFYLGRGNGDVDHNTNVDNFDNTDNTNNIVDNTTPRKPIVDWTNPNVSPYTTEQFNFHLEANVYYVDGPNNITFKQNGLTSTNFSYNANTDEFHADVVLQPGQNIFELTGINAAGSDQETTIIIFKQEDIVVKNPPIVTITHPSTSGTTVTNPTYAFSSTVLNVSGKQNITVTFNGANLTNFTYNTTSKVLNTTLTLVEGTNVVTVTGVNGDGTDSKTTKIIYNRPLVQQPPVVTITSPSANPYTTAVSSVSVHATVLNVDAKANIEVKVNGAITSNFTYNTSTKQVVLNIPSLLPGVNVVSVKGTNNVGSDIASTTIIYRLPKTPKPPIVDFINPPSSPTTVYVSNYALVAKVLYVNSQNDITVKVNGVSTSNFTYSPSSQQVHLNLVLNPGSNVVEVIGVNQDGQDSESTTLIYKRPVVQMPPVVDVSYPASDNQVFSTPNITVVATVLNVSSASNIEVKFNGNVTTAFTFNTATKVLSLPVTLVSGNNTVQITGTNSVGSDSKTRLIIYKKPVKQTPPTVVITNPATSPKVVNQASFIFKATTTFIDSKNQIVLKQNGVIVSANQYSYSNHSIVYNTTLDVGNNIFEVSVANTFGSDSKMAIVNFQQPEPCTAPTVGYIAPQPNSTVLTENISIDAQINNHIAGTVVTLTHNGVSVGNMSYNSTTSIASKGVVLTEGSNSFQVHVSNECGENQSTFVIVLKLANVPCLSPTISSVNPLTTTLSTEDDTYSLQLGVTGVSNAASIVVTNGGVSIPFSYGIADHILQINNVSLVEGLNTIKVVATNDCGSEELIYEITRTICHPPVVSISSVNTSATAGYKLIGNVTNVSSSQDITVTLNGTAVNFSHIAATGSLVAGLNLVEGNNTIVITANGCESVSETIDVVYTAPCNVPVITLTSATAATTSSYALAGTVTNIDNNSDVTVTLNGTTVSSTYNATTGILASTFSLVEGSNAIVVTANGCESVSKTLNVIYTAPCNVPVITLTSATAATTSSYALAGTVTNIDNNSDVTVTLNGTTVSSTYNATTGILASTFSLVEGSNAIVVTANGCESVNKTLNVIYTAPCNVPVITLTSATAATTSSYALAGTVTNIDNNSDVTVTLNGTTVSSTYNATTGILASTFSLVEGSNAIVVTANGCESVSKTLNVVYTAPCNVPVITLTSATAATTSSYALAGTVTNIDNNSDVTVTLNGTTVSSTYNATTGILASTFSLVEGSNAIVVTANGCESVSKTLNVVYTAPCNVPVITLTSATAATTSSYALAGTVTNIDNNSDVTVTLNGTTVSSTYNATTGILASTFSLVEGSNAIVVTANGCESVSKTLNVVYTAPCNVPVITLTSATAATTSSYALAGTVTNIDNNSDVTVTLNGTTVSFTYNATTGILASTFSLVEGSNAIVVTANGCESVSKTLNVVYTAPCNVPVITLTSATAATTSSYALAGTVTNIDNNSDVTVTLNGTTVSSTYNATTGILASTFSLVEGSNAIVVTANGCESVSKTLNVVYTAPCNVPVITLTSATAATTSSYALAGTVTNIDNNSDVTVTLNGTTVSFTYNATTGILASTFSLVEGSNAIVVTANGCESVSKTLNVVYTAPCNVPVITLTSATAATTSSYALAGTVTNIDNNSDVTVTLNGTTVSSTYNATTGILASTFSLVEGSNAIVVTANGCESVSKTLNVVYTAPCNVPVITLTSATAATTSSYALAGTVTNIDNNSDVTVTLNGTTVSFTYNATTGILASTFSLVEGSNAIVVTANGCESVSKTLNVVYTVPCDIPVIEVVPNSTVTESNYSLECEVIEATAATVTVNGNPVASNYDVDSNTLTASIMLNDGDNIIAITAIGCGPSNMQDFVITYTPPCDVPVITLTSATAATTSSYALAGTVTNIDNNSDVTVTLNGATVSSTYNATTGVLAATFSLVEGSNAIVVTANGCESVSKTLNVVYTAPCVAPVISNVNTSAAEALSLTGNQGTTITLTATIINVTLNSDVTVTLNGTAVASSYDATTGLLTASFPGVTGDNNIVITANGCEIVTSTQTVVVEEEECDPPVIALTSAAAATTSSYALAGTVTNIDNNSDVTVSLNGTTVSSTYNATTGILAATLTLAEGSNTILVTANGCESVTKTLSLELAIEPCGPRFNPGNSDWQFCLVTPSGTYSRDDLSSNSNFTYSGSASSLYFKPIAGGGTAIVNGNPYPVQNGQYYLFTGNLTVDVSSSHPGSMGHWEVCVTSDSNPTFGNGNNRPTSPCEDENKDQEVLSKPTIVPVTPQTVSSNVTTSTLLFKANLTDVPSKANIQMTVNGIRYTSFMYSTTTKQLSGVIRLKSGSNNITVTATNASGRVSKSYTVIYKPKVNTTTKPNNTNTKPNNTNTKPTTTTNRPTTTTTKPSTTTTKPTTTTTKPTTTTTKPSTTTNKPKPSTTGGGTKTTTTSGKTTGGTKTTTTGGTKTKTTGGGR